MKSALTRFASCRLDVLQQKLMPFAKLRSRIGVPQTVALLLLLVFVAQCLWFMARVPLSATEGSYIETGLLHLERFASASSPERSPLVPLLAGLAARLSGAESRILYLNDYRLVIRLPFLLVGLLLGASLWYVARRLDGNIGGYIALGLYAFSPVMVGCSARSDRESLARGEALVSSSLPSRSRTRYTLHAKWCCGTGAAFR